eukprot:jgi/Phyca11/130836/e_gw1.98.122.1
MDEFLSVLDRVDNTLEESGLFLGLNKICSYTTEAKWYGRIIKVDGVAYGPDKIRILVDLPEPHTAGELQQFLCAAGWMRNSHVGFAREGAPLQDKLQVTLAGTKRTKNVAARIVIGLSEPERDSLYRVKQLLMNAATLVTPDDDESSL